MRGCIWCGDQVSGVTSVTRTCPQCPLHSSQQIRYTVTRSLSKYNQKHHPQPMSTLYVIVNWKFRVICAQLLCWSLCSCVTPVWTLITLVSCRGLLSSWHPETVRLTGEKVEWWCWYYYATEDTLWASNSCWPRMRSRVISTSWWAFSN